MSHPLRSIQPVIAIIDDDPSVRRGLARLLRSSGFATVPFESAEAFLASDAEGTKYRCLLVDIHLGSGMNGIELARLLRERNGGSPAPLIFITAQPESTQALSDECAITCLAKPLDEDLLLSTLNRLC